MWTSTAPVVSLPTTLRIRQGDREWVSPVWPEDTRIRKDGGLLLNHPDEANPVYWDDVCADEEPYEWALVDEA